MNLDDINFSVKHYSMLKNNLKKTYNIDMNFFEALDYDLLEALCEKVSNLNSEICMESVFVTGHSNTPIPLLTEALRIYLKEVYPQKKAKFKESIQYKIDPNTGAALSGNGVERPDLYWRGDQFKLERALTQRLQNPNTTPEDYIKYDPRDANPTDAPSNETNIYVSVLNPEKINGMDPEVLQITTDDGQDSSSPVVQSDGKVKITDINSIVQKLKGVDMKKIKDMAAVTESVMLEESELQRAEIVLATKDIVSRLQKQIEDISSMATDDVLPLVDGMKENFGHATANSFAQKAEEALQTASDGIQTLRDLFDNYARALEKHIGDGSVPNDMTMDADNEQAITPPSSETGGDEMATPDPYEKKDGGENAAVDGLMGESITVGGKTIKLSESQKAAIKFARQYTKAPMPVYLLSEGEKKQLKIASKLLKGNN